MRERKTRAVADALSIVAALVAASAAASGAAADICVACTGPDASYACKVDTAAMPSDDPRLKLLCITELAKAGGHQSCTVSRAVTAPCPGEVKPLAAPGLDAPPPAAPAASTPAPANAGNVPAPPPAAAAPVESEDSVTTVPKSTPPPKTVQEAVENGASGTGDALKKTGEGAANVAEQAGGAMQKAGKAVGDAAKSTWKCLSTLFSDC